MSKRAGIGLWLLAALLLVCGVTGRGFVGGSVYAQATNVFLHQAADSDCGAIAGGIDDLVDGVIDDVANGFEMDLASCGGSGSQMDALMSSSTGETLQVSEMRFYQLDSAKRALSVEVSYTDSDFNYQDLGSFDLTDSDESVIDFPAVRGWNFIVVVLGGPAVERENWLLNEWEAYYIVSPTSTSTPTRTPTSTPSATITNTPTLGVSPTFTLTPTSTPTVGVGTPVPTSTPVVGPGPGGCGAMGAPCYTRVLLPTLTEAHGGVFLGELMVFSLVFAFLSFSARVVVGAGFLTAIFLTVLSGAIAYEYGWILLLVGIVTLESIRRWARGSRVVVADKDTSP